VTSRCSSWTSGTLAHIPPSTNRAHTSSAVAATATSAPITASTGFQYWRWVQNPVQCRPVSAAIATMTAASPIRLSQERPNPRMIARAPPGSFRPK